jgi:hypothetical protein
MTLSKYDNPQNNFLPLCWVSRFNYYYAECHYAECRYAECRDAKFITEVLFYNHLLIIDSF